MMKWIDKYLWHTHIAFAGFGVGLIAAIILREEFAFFLQTILDEFLLLIQAILGLGWGKSFSYFIPGLLLVVSGALAIMVKEMFDRRREVNEWFLDAYVKNGLDPVLIHLNKLYNMSFELVSSREDANSSFPADAVDSILVILDGTNIWAIVTYLHLFNTKPNDLKSYLSEDENNRLNQIHLQLIKQLRRIKAECLKISLKRRADIYRINRRVPIAKSKKVIKAEFDKLSKLFSIASNKPSK